MTKRSDSPLSARYAKQRLMRILTDMVEGDQLLSWSALAADITVFRGVEFSRENLRRLRKCTLGPANVEIIIQYLEQKHDPNIRERLRPEAIFDEMAQSARDYYFHMPEQNDMDDWNDQLLEEFEGVYFCGLAGNTETYLPSKRLLRLIQKQQNIRGKEPQQTGMAVTLFTSRTILVLRRTSHGYFHAAEIPLSSLVPTKLKTPCQRVFYEGIAVISANTIQVKLRDCLTRIPRTHSIAILSKPDAFLKKPHGLSIYTGRLSKEVEQIWRDMNADDIADLKQEHDLAIASDNYMQGKALHSQSPLPVMDTKISNIVSNDIAYFPKPRDFLKYLDDHFFLGDITDVDTIRKIVESPLIIGTLDEH